MEQIQMEPRGQRKKRHPKLEFDAAKVFGTSKDHELEIDVDAARYTAEKGEGGDRRA